MCSLQRHFGETERAVTSTQSEWRKKFLYVVVGLGHMENDTNGNNLMAQTEKKSFKKN